MKTLAWNYSWSYHTCRCSRILAYFSWATGHLCTQYYEEMLREKAGINYDPDNFKTLQAL